MAAPSSALAPRADTTRYVEWDELPDTVKSIPQGFDPLADGVLMRHQAEWVGIDAPIKVCPKGRRTGITFAEALSDTLIAASRRSAGGQNIYYIGDTKEKGLEFVGYVAHLARVIAEAQGAGCSRIEEFIFKDQQPDGSTKDITAYRIRFASGFAVVALSAKPASIRGLQGIVVIDEAAFHAKVAAVLEAATALLIWGGKIRVISSHNGKKNPFNQLVRDIEMGQYGPDAKVYTATFDDAVRNGLYERVCLMTRQQPTDEGKKKWYTQIRQLYGPRKAAMREELDAIPRDGAGASIPGVWIDRAMREERTVLRLTLDDDFVRLPDQVRRDYAKSWIKQHLLPELAKLDKSLPHVYGQDYARHRNFTEFTPMALTQQLKRVVPFVVELHNVPSRQQEQILWALIDGLPRFGGGSMDATGPGQQMAEYTADKYGHQMIHQVTLNVGWYAAWMPKLVQRFEDDHIDLPRDATLEADLRCVEDVDGVPRVPDANTRDLKDPELFRHGDFAISLALAEHAALNLCAEFAFESGGPRSDPDDMGAFING